MVRSSQTRVNPSVPEALHSPAYDTGGGAGCAMLGHDLKMIHGGG